MVTDHHRAPGSDLYATGGGQRRRHRDVIAFAVSRPRRVAIVGTPNGVAVLRPCGPQARIPTAIIGAMVIGILIYVALQVAFLLALPDGAIGKTWDAEAKGLYTLFTNPVAEPATLLGIGWLAAMPYADAMISRPARP